MDFNLGFTIGWGIGALICALLSFFFGTCEMSLTSTSLNKWNQVLAKKNNWNNRLVKMMIEHYKIALGTVLIGNMMTTIIASTFIANIINQFVSDNVITVLSFVIAFVVLIFCEYLPKTLARNNPVGWLKIIGIPLYFCYILLWPISKLFSLIFRQSKKVADPATEELRVMNFKDAVVGDRMIPIEKVDTLILNGSNEELTHRISLSNFTSLPVLNKKQEIIGCIRTDVFLKGCMHDNRTDARRYVSKLTLVSKDAYMTEVLSLANSERPIIGVISPKNPKKLLGIVSTYQLMQQISHDVFSVN